MNFKARKAVEFSLSEDGDVEVAYAGLGDPADQKASDIDKDQDVSLIGSMPVGKEVPISSYAHASWPERGGRLPVGKGKIEERGKIAVLRGRFFTDTTTGRDTYLTVKGLGDLQEWSFGYDVLDGGPGTWDGREVNLNAKYDVHEVSPVLIGAGTDTRTLAIKEATKGAIGSHETAKAAESASWDAAAEVSAAEGAATLRKMHAWVDAEGDPEAKSSYKLPHHTTEGSVVWRGVAAAMGALMGSRGGVAIPSGDRRGVYAHLARHYAQFDKDVPEFKDGEPASPLEVHFARVLGEVDGFTERVKALAELRQSEGRQLSEVNRQRLSLLVAALEEMQEVKDRAISLLAAEEPVDLKQALRSFEAEWLMTEARVSALTRH